MIDNYLVTAKSRSILLASSEDMIYVIKVVVFAGNVAYKMSIYARPDKDRDYTYVTDGNVDSGIYSSVQKSSDTWTLHLQTTFLIESMVVILKILTFPGNFFLRVPSGDIFS